MQRKTIEEVEDALRELVLLRTSHHGEDPALQLVAEFFVGARTPRRERSGGRNSRERSGQLRRHRRHRQW